MAFRRLAHAAAALVCLAGAAHAQGRDPGADPVVTPAPQPAPVPVPVPVPADPGPSVGGRDPGAGGASQTPATVTPVLPGIDVVAVAPAPLGAGDPPPRSTHGAWYLRCDPIQGGEQCALIQSVLGIQRQDVGLAVLVIRAPDGSTFMRMVAPLGVLMQPGLGLIIDGNDLGQTSYIKCTADGCIAEVALDATLTGQLSEGREAVFRITAEPAIQLGIPVSLEGFAEGLAALP
jgi:invasion protein IalB